MKRKKIMKCFKKYKSEKDECVKNREGCVSELNQLKEQLAKKNPNFRL